MSTVDRETDNRRHAQLIRAVAESAIAHPEQLDAITTGAILVRGWEWVTKGASGDWQVADGSWSRPLTVRIDVNRGETTCDCRDGRSGRCEHVWAVRLHLLSEEATAPVAR